MPRRDPPLPAVFDGPLGQHLQGLRVRVVGLVHVHVDVGVVVAGDLEGEGDMPGAVPPVLLVERHPAHQVGTGLHRPPHQVVGALVLEDAFLREGDDLDVRDVAGAPARLEHAFERAQTADAVHVHMGAQARHAVGDGGADRPRRTRGDLVHPIGPLALPDDFDRLVEGPRQVGARAVVDLRLVEVDVRLQEAWHAEAPARVDGLVGPRRAGLGRGDEASVLHQEVARCRFGPDARVRDRQIDPVVRHRPPRLLAGPRGRDGSSTAAGAPGRPACRCAWARAPQGCILALRSLNRKDRPCSPPAPPWCSSWR